MVKPATLAQNLNACPAEEFFGRHAELDAITRLARDGARGPGRLLAIAGPPGSGKSALLRRAAIVLHDRGAELTPLLIDLADLADPSEARASSAEREAGRDAGRPSWGALYRSILRQVLALMERVDATAPVWLDPAPGQLASLCHAAGLGALAALDKPNLALSIEAWRALLRALPASQLPRPMLFIDGAAQPGPRAADRLAQLADGCRAEGIAAILEAPREAARAFFRDPGAVEELELGPLAAGEALAIVQAAGRRRRWALPEAALLPVVQRLGPWPGWVRDWGMSIAPLPPGASPIRHAEEAYADWLWRSPWAEGLSRGLARAVPPQSREAALKLAQAAQVSQEALDFQEAAAVTGLEPAEVHALLEGLTGLGLLERRGLRWAGARWQALADWVRLTLAGSTLPHSLEAARLELLTRHLTEPRPMAEEPASGADSATLAPALLARFRGQPLPQILFQFGEFNEALGKHPPARRREAVVNATATVTLPEVIGVVAYEGPGATSERPEHAPHIHYARAYRDGRYQRSHEELWIVFDWSAVRALTSPEIAQGLDLARRLESRLGAGRFVRWVILGETASPEALEYLRRERLFCSSREQLLLMRELLTPAPAPGAALRGVARVAPEMSAAAPTPALDSTIDDEPPPRRSVIEMAEAAADQRAESSHLSLPARPDSELIAAMMAEKIAIRGGFDAAAVGQIKTAVLEGSLNAIEHSSNTEKLIEIDFDLTADSIAISIENEGPPFDPLAVPVPHPPDKLSAARKRGWGLTLMHRFMDEVGYEPCRRGTRLRLVKRRAVPAIVASIGVSRDAKELKPGAIRDKA